MRGLVGFPTKTIKKRVRIEKVASFCGIEGAHTKTIQEKSKLRRLLQLSWSSIIPDKNHSKTSLSRKGCFDLGCLGGFLTKTIKKRSKIEKVSSIWVV